MRRFINDTRDNCLSTDVEELYFQRAFSIHTCVKVENAMDHRRGDDAFVLSSSPLTAKSGQRSPRINMGKELCFED